MNRILPTLLLLGISAASSRALELTPHEIAFAANSPLAAKRYYFLDGSKRVGFRLDNKMSIFGDGESAHLRFEDLATATAKIARSQTPPEILFEGKTLDNYRAAARAFID